MTNNVRLIAFKLQTRFTCPQHSLNPESVAHFIRVVVVVVVVVAKHWMHITTTTLHTIWCNSSCFTSYQSKCRSVCVPQCCACATLHRVAVQLFRNIKLHQVHKLFKHRINCSKVQTAQTSKVKHIARQPLDTRFDISERKWSRVSRGGLFNHNERRKDSTWWSLMDSKSFSKWLLTPSNPST